MLHFQYPSLLWLLLLMPALFGVWLFMRHRKRKQLCRFASNEMFGRLIPDESRWRPVVKILLVLLGFSCLIVAIANPQVGSKMVKGEHLGSDVAICLDISNSMMAEDLQPNRLERSKRLVTNLMNEMAGDRVSLVVFAGTSFIQMPLTNDYSATRLFLDQIDCSMIATQGTAIGDAIQKAMSSLGFGEDGVEWQPNNNRAIIIISDGENFEDDAVGAAQAAADEGVIVCTIGVGRTEGTPIPIVNANGQHTGYKQDKDGNVVTTKLNETMLADIANAGKGVYLRASDISAGLGAIIKRLEGLDKDGYDEAMFSEYESRYAYPLVAALVFFLLEILLFERRNRRFDIDKLLSK